MGFHTANPSELLAPFVKSYWGMESCLPSGKEHIQRIVPNGLTELMFYLGDLPESMDAKKSLLEHSLLSGQQKEYYDIRISGFLSLFSIIFQPHGLVVFFDLPVGEIFNQNVPLKYVLKDIVDDFELILTKAESFSDRIMIVERFLAHRISKSSRKYEFDRIKHSIGLINRTRGIVAIEYLASAACLSRKQYERTFLNYVGSTPKQFLRTVRFQNAINEKAKRRDISLTELAYQCGYYDQSHMTSDFHKLSGMTPKKYFSDSVPYSDYF